MTEPAGKQDEIIQAAVDRYRDLAKYLVGIFAAIGALLVAGTQLSSIGALSWSDDRGRLIAAGAGLVIALTAVGWVVQQAVQVLRPVDMSLEDVARDAKLRAVLEQERLLRDGVGSVEMLAELTRNRTLTTDEERAKWHKVSVRVVDRAAYLLMQRRFDRAWQHMVVAAAIGALGVAVLAWAANPPDDPASATVAAPVTPVKAVVSLTAAGREALGEAIGPSCRGPVAALIVGGSSSRPKVVTTAADRGCRPAQFVLAPGWGHARRLAIPGG